LGKSINLSFMIRSYVKRLGRISPRQRSGLDLRLASYQLPVPQSDNPWNFLSLFGTNAKIVLEIGFGMGASMVTMAEANPEILFIGIEVHDAGVGSLAADLHDNNIGNVFIAPYDAMEVFHHALPDNSLDGIQIFFPDPWPKTRHHKRRLIQPDFVKLLSAKLVPHGFLHCATDWQHYAEQMLRVLSQEIALSNTYKHGGFADMRHSRPLTKFEKRGEKLGHGIWDLYFLKN
jgi:tRNA (guanine-N7-)-methyltransferase